MDISTSHVAKSCICNTIFSVLKKITFIFIKEKNVLFSCLICYIYSIETDAKIY